MSRNGHKVIKTLADLTPDPANARKHNPRNVGMLVDSLHQVGAARSIVVDEDGVVLAGNATIEAAAEAGIHKVRSVEADGNEIIAVVRRGLTKEQKTKLALYDNRVAELAEWNPDILAELVDTKAIDGLFSEYELSQLIEGLSYMPDNPLEHWKGMPEFEQGDESPFRTIAIHFHSATAVEKFAILLNQSIGASTKYLWYPAEPKQVAADKSYIAGAI